MLRSLPPPAWRPTPRTRHDLRRAAPIVAGGWALTLVEPALGLGCMVAGAGWLARSTLRNSHLTAEYRRAWKARAYEAWSGWARLPSLARLDGWDAPLVDHYIHVHPEDWLPASRARPMHPQAGMGAHVREWRKYRKRARLEGLRVIPRRVTVSVPYRPHITWRQFRKHWNEIHGFPGTPDAPIDPWRWDTTRRVEGVVIGEPFGMPQTIPLPDQPAWSLDVLRLGVLEDGSELVWDLREIPHGLLGGSTRFGKTGLLRLIALQFILGAWWTGQQPGVVILDPKGDEYVCFERPGWWNPAAVEGVHVAVDELDADGNLTTLDTMVAAARAVRQELGRRRRASRAMAAAGQEPIWRPIILIVDEAAELLEREGDKTSPESQARDGQRRELERTIRTIARLGAKFRGHVIAAAQSPRAEFLPADAKINLAYLLFVGPGSPTELGIIFGKDLPDSPPARRGMGVWKDHREGVDPLDPYLYFKGFWLSPEDISATLGGVLEPATAA